MKGKISKDEFSAKRKLRNMLTLVIYTYQAAQI